MARFTRSETFGEVFLHSVRYRVDDPIGGWSSCHYNNSAKIFWPYVAPSSHRKMVSKLSERWTFPDVTAIFGWVCVVDRQTDTQNTINFLPNHSIKTMKFMLSPPQKNLQRWRVAGGKKSSVFDMSQMVNWMDYKGWRTEEEVISPARQVFLGIEIREKLSSSRWSEIEKSSSMNP